MADFEKHTIQTSRRLTYTYYVSRSEDGNSLPALLLHHGWPDHAAMWFPLSNHLRKKGVRNTIIAPDMLGYDGTSKPTDPAAYTFDKQTRDIAQILDAQSIAKVISVGHDWGSRAAQCFYSYYPERVEGMILLNVAYAPPARQKFSLEETNAATKQIFGYPLYDYWHLFTSPDGHEILGSNIGRLYSALHAEPKTGMRDFFCVPDAMRNYLLASSDVPEVSVRPYARDPAMKQDFVDRMTRDGFAAPQCWYKAMVQNCHYEVEKHLPAERDKLEVPLLFIGATDDAVCRPEMMIPVKEQGLVPHLEEHMVDSAHWTPYEKPDEVSDLIVKWLGTKFGGNK